MKGRVNLAFYGVAAFAATAAGALVLLVAAGLSRYRRSREWKAVHGL